MRSQRLLLPFVAAAVLAAGTPARCQESGTANAMKDLLYGRTAPLTLKLKDLNSDWRRVTIGAPGDAAGGGGGMMGALGAMFGSMFGGGGGTPSNVFYTQGQTLAVGGQTFLITYRPSAKSMDLGALMAMGGAGGKPPAPEKLGAETGLALSLMNVSSIASLGEIRAFDMAREIAESEAAAKTQEALMKSSPFGGLGPGAGEGPEPAIRAEPAAPAKPAKPAVPKKR